MHWKNKTTEQKKSLPVLGQLIIRAPWYGVLLQHVTICNDESNMLACVNRASRA